MLRRPEFVALIFASILSHGAFANDDQSYENWLARIGDYETLYRAWWPEAMAGDAEKQERLAELLLGSHARKTGAQPYEGVHFLFRAAVNGRPLAMRRLGDALNKGISGLSKRADAARCWSSAPASFEARLACVGLTEFDDPRARVPCTELAVVEAKQYPETRDGAAMAKLCLANKTAAILVQGLPPNQHDLERVREYERHGIEWSMTGDVYSERFETFRRKFNQTIVVALEARHGSGYLDRVAKRIDAQLARK